MRIQRGLTVCAGTSSKELDSLISAQPRTKEDFVALSNNIVEFIIKRHQAKPLYATFVETLIRELAMPLRDVEVRKAASVLTTLANEKQKEARDKASGKKKGKAAKPALGAAKVAGKCVPRDLLLSPSIYTDTLRYRLDTGVYDEALDDFGSNADDFM